MGIHTVDKFGIAYGQIPSKRNQDVIRIEEYEGGKFSVAVVDGWNNLDYLPDNVSGRRVAEFVVREFPRKFLTIIQKFSFSHTKAAAKRIAEEIDGQVLAMYPAHASCVGAFLFSFQDTNIIVSVGNRAIGILLWCNHSWCKPKEIGDYTIEYPKYPSDESRFFGRGELKKDPMYSCVPDVMTISDNTPVMFATDGIEDVFVIQDINELPVSPARYSAKEIVETMLREISRRGTQRDDISILVRTAKDFAKSRQLREDREDERDAAELSRKDRGNGIPIKSIGKKYRFTID